MKGLHDLFASYEARFARAMAALPQRQPWVEGDREEILENIRNCLGIKEAWVPEIVAHVAQTSSVAGPHGHGFLVEHLQSTSWPGCMGAADLYLPEAVEVGGEPLPVVILACGHGKGGKAAEPYRRMAVSLVRRGIAVLVADNMGQGERVAMGHAEAVQVFECGLSLQGLIVMEAMGWLAWLQSQKRFDSTRIAAIGNSGGGALTLFLGALRRDELAVVSSSGYPSTFEFIARKEKKHCHCNLLPGIVGKLEMWHVYGAIAPKPLFLFQGLGDSLFPGDLLMHTARKVSTVYEHYGAAEQLRACLVEGGHSWDAARCRMLTEYLCERLGVSSEEGTDAPEAPEALTEPLLALLPPCFQTWPPGAKTVDEVARDLSGCAPTATQLWELFGPDAALPSGESPFLRGEARQIFAQFELFLGKAP